MKKIRTKDGIILNIIRYLEDNFKDNIVTVFGIGSYFDKTLPSDWNITDIDVIVVVKSLIEIPKPEWTEVRYETKILEHFKIWIAYNTLHALKEKEIFAKESFANYEWSILDLKCQENSQILYGKDIRNQLPKISELKFDFDDIFARSLYHLDKSLKLSKSSRKSTHPKREYTKAVFKLGFYLCKYLDKSHYLTSVHNISIKIEKLHIESKIMKNMLHFMKESKMYRETNSFSTEFNILRKNFIFFIISMLRNGDIHKKLEFQEIFNFLSEKFNSLPYLTSYIKMAKKIYNSSKN